MASEPSTLASQTITIDADDELSSAMPEFRFIGDAVDEVSSHTRQVGFSAPSIAIDASLMSECVMNQDLCSVDSSDSDAPLSVAEDGQDTQYCRRLERELNDESMARRQGAAEARSRQVQDEEDEYLFRRYLARQERRRYRSPFVPPCVSASPWFKSVCATFSQWLPNAASDPWSHYDVRHCECLGGPQGFHRPNCTYGHAAAAQQQF